MRAPHHAELADDALVAGLAVEDSDAATAFVRRFQAKVFGLALAVTRDPALADDVAQEAFLRAWRSASTYDGLRGSVSAWLLTITRNAAIDAVRARRSVPADDDELDRLLQATLGGQAAMDATGESATTAVEAGRVLARLRGLPPEQARSVVLAVFGGCTADEISRRDGVPLGTAKTRIRTGLRRLRQDEQRRTTGHGGSRWVTGGTRHATATGRSTITSTWSRWCSATSRASGGRTWPPTCWPARRAAASTTRSPRRSPSCCRPCRRCNRRSASTSRCWGGSGRAHDGGTRTRDLAAAPAGLARRCRGGGRHRRRRASAGGGRRASTTTPSPTSPPLELVNGGDAVGTVSISDVDGAPLMVVALVDAPDDVSYLCRTTFADGTTADSEAWPPGNGAWIVPLPADGADAVRSVDLVVDGTDHVWSTASFDDRQLTTPRTSDPRTVDADVHGVVICVNSWRKRSPEHRLDGRRWGRRRRPTCRGGSA